MLPQPSPYRDPSVLTSHSNSPHTSIECRLPSVLFTTSLKHTQRINKGTSEGNDKMTLCQEVYIATDTQHLFQSGQNNYLNIFSLKIEHNHSQVFCTMEWSMALFVIISLHLMVVQWFLKVNHCFLCCSMVVQCFFYNSIIVFF